MPTVVVCDDEPDVRLLCRMAFELEGWDVVEAANGRDCIDVMRVLEPLPDCVVIDVMMPVMDGLSALVAMHADQLLQTVPVLLLSAKAGTEDVERGMRAGATDYVTKPFSPWALVERAVVVARAA